MNAGTILVVNDPDDQTGSVTPRPDGRGSKPPLVAIVGPTAAGKTGLAIDLAARLPLEVVNADSRAFYRGMDIGTAKPDATQRAKVPHHLIDILDPDEPMSLSRFQDLAMETIASIHARDAIPVLVGGTPQYVNAVVEGWNIPRVPPDPAYRERLEREADEAGIDLLHRRLSEVDPEAAARTGPNLRRIIRALEVYNATGIPFSRLQTRSEVPFDPLELELWLPREELYRRIDTRVDDQIAAGLIAEVRSLLEAGYPPDLPAFSSIGYRQLMPAITSNDNVDQAVKRIKLDTHRFVRHQQTWARKNPRLIRIDMTSASPVDRALEYIRRHCEPYLSN